MIPVFIKLKATGQVFRTLNLQIEDMKTSAKGTKHITNINEFYDPVTPKEFKRAKLIEEMAAKQRELDALDEDETRTDPVQAMAAEEQTTTHTKEIKKGAENPDYIEGADRQKMSRATKALVADKLRAGFKPMHVAHVMGISQSGVSRIHKKVKKEK